MVKTELLFKGDSLSIRFIRGTKADVDTKINLLQEPDRKKTIGLIKAIGNGGFPNNEQKSRHLVGKLYELKPTSQVRIPFFYSQSGEIILTHVFIKKGNKTPKNEIECGLQWYQAFQNESKIG